MPDILFSIIIPHYNIPELLMRCLNSIPVRENIQVIVVDDCSPDADKYKESYPELSRPYLEYYSTPIGGSAGRARNVGFTHAKGKWVICLDSDDLFVDNVEEILSGMVDRDEDILYFNYKSVYSDDLTKEASRNLYHPYFEQYKENQDESNFRYRFQSIWGKVIKRSLIEKYHIRCDEVRCADDVSFSLKCGIHANKIAVIDIPLFVITERTGSLEFANKGIKPIWEYKLRTKIALECQAYADKHGKGIETRQYISEAIGFFHHYKKAFVPFYCSMIPRYPNLCFNIMKVWVGSKFNKNILMPYK